MSEAVSMITTVTLNTSVDKLYLVEKLEDYTVMRVKKVSNTTQRAARA